MEAQGKQNRTLAYLVTLFAPESEGCTRITFISDQSYGLDMTTAWSSMDSGPRFQAKRLFICESLKQVISSSEEVGVRDRRSGRGISELDTLPINGLRYHIRLGFT